MPAFFTNTPFWLAQSCVWRSYLLLYGFARLLNINGWNTPWPVQLRRDAQWSSRPKQSDPPNPVKQWHSSWWQTPWPPHALQTTNTIPPQKKIKKHESHDSIEMWYNSLFTTTSIPTPAFVAQTFAINTLSTTPTVFRTGFVTTIIEIRRIHTSIIAISASSYQ